MRIYAVNALQKASWYKKRDYALCPLILYVKYFKLGEMFLRSRFQIIDAWGWLIKNTSNFDDGLMKMFQLGQIDYSMNSILIRVDRMRVLHYTSELAQGE